MAKDTFDISIGSISTNGLRMNEKPNAIQKEAHGGHKNASLAIGILVRNRLIGDIILEWLQRCDNAMVVKKKTMSWVNMVIIISIL